MNKWITIVLSIFLFFFVIILLRQNNDIKNLKKEIEISRLAESKLKIELQETENRCERMTDTCIDIITNKRWE